MFLYHYSPKISGVNGYEEPSSKTDSAHVDRLSGWVHTYKNSTSVSYFDHVHTEMSSGESSTPTFLKIIILKPEYDHFA